MRRTVKENVCLFCKVKFVYTSSRIRKYCSRQCYTKSRLTGKTIGCAYCGKNKYVKKDDVGKHTNHFCSTTCHGLFNINKIKLTCQMCGKEFEDTPSNHDRKFCSWECKISAQKKSIRCVCIICGKHFEIFERYNNGNGAKFCSQRCKSSQKIEKICKQCNKSFMVKPSQSSQVFCSRKCQVKNSDKKRKRVCKHCGREFMAAFPGYKRTFCSRVCVGKSRIKNEIHKTSICSTCGKEFTHTVYDVGRYCSKKCYLSNDGVSGVELMLKDPLLDVGFEHQLKYTLGYMDYGNERKKVAVFVDGVFWHGKNDGEWEHTKMAPSIKKAKVRDIEQTAYLESRGWVVLRYWDDYVRARIDECLSDILKVVHNR